MRHRLACLLLLPLLILSAVAAGAADNPRRPFADDVVYFLVTDRFANGDPANDRGGLIGGPAQHGFDPADIGMFQGGDLKGLTARLDYIAGLGATAIWITPPVVNKVVQQYEGGMSAGYHGYWATDFLNVDPHSGSNADFRAFVDAAHARGLKVIMDIVVNHTADIIQYQECRGAGNACPYRSQGDYPGAAYIPVLPSGQQGVKNPAWLNDVRHYHNRGDSSFKGESSLLGDFARLDDLRTEDPVVAEGLIKIYKHWIGTYRIDGLRLDTAKHVNPDFWHRFVPEITTFAQEQGIADFTIFGEVADRNIADLAAQTHLTRLPSVLDFGFFQAAIDTLADGQGSYVWENWLRADILYPDTLNRATLPTFISNHDNGRLAYFIRRTHPQMPADEVQARVMLGHALMFLGRGVPVLYYGDEQGFIGLGDDKQARQPMFATASQQFNTEPRLGPHPVAGGDSFNPAHPLYRATAELAAIRRDHPGLRRGEMVIRHVEEKGGLLAFSRIDRVGGREYLVLVNMDNTPRTLGVPVEASMARWQGVRGACPVEGSAPSAIRVTVPGLDYLVCMRPLA
ncbi:alpha-amylase family glycosyl hydrolase [Niveispirillum sp. BGYR6]|uniref:alpha-amylase family glycosyl hydrolase n=1 Tax=Niveispirillum sp. BGYR6 TaxID=2971249 RepID=UPI0022B9C6AD|nr:alpha-amylase family glycosyl hydrolase [Niveispirillum sp. BGYR6]MDG5496680.1 alpha-amylase family glycosyl hydrolase [Niveispirillum sp. BGYR6]